MFRNISILTTLLLAFCCSTTFAQSAAEGDDKKTERIMKHDVRSIEVKYIKASEVATTLEKSFGFLFTANDSINRIYAWVPDENWPEVEAVLDTILDDAKEHRAKEATRRKEIQPFSRPRELDPVERVPEKTGTVRGRQKTTEWIETAEGRRQASSNSDDVLKVFPIRHCHAEDISDGIYQLLPSLKLTEDDEVLIESMPGKNRLVVRGSSEMVAKIGECIAALDQPAVNDDRSVATDYFDRRSDLEQTKSGFGQSSTTSVVPATSLFGQSSLDSKPLRQFRVSELTTENIQRKRSEYETTEKLAASTASELRTVSDPQSETAQQLRVKLETVVSKAFNERQKLQLMELTAQQEKLKHLQRQIQDRQKLADEIVGRRMEELLDGNDQSTTTSAAANIDDLLSPAKPSASSPTTTRGRSPAKSRDLLDSDPQLLQLLKAIKSPDSVSGSPEPVKPSALPVK